MPSNSFAISLQELLLIALSSMVDIKEIWSL